MKLETTLSQGFGDSTAYHIPLHKRQRKSSIFIVQPESARYNFIVTTANPQFLF